MKLQHQINIGYEVKQIRRSLGMTQAQLAERAGMRQNAIAVIESGKRRNLQKFPNSING